MKVLKKNPLSSEHLKRGEKSVIACFGTFSDFEKTEPSLCKILLSPSFDHEKSDTENVDYYAKPTEWKNINAKTAGTETYVISSVSSRDKLTRYLYDCTSVFAVGREKKTRKNISFLSHQDPTKFLRERYREQFTNNLTDSLTELKSLCVRGTIDVVISGGMFLPDLPDAEWCWDDARRVRKMYKQSISLLSEIIVEVLGFEPVVICGPKKVERSDSVFCVNKTRHMYIARPQVENTMTESFLPQYLDIQEEKW
ncbi:MAG: hypothetical protein NT098_03785 [Candidatus Parcubacteria bacterium]|nr:hypothetical protein [Candidatus Parcubacteria bacterium]